MNMMSTTEFYEKLHQFNPDYKQKNQGLDCIDMWLDQIHRNYTYSHAKIIEIGCGNGILCKRLVESGHDVSGIDFVDGNYDRGGYKFKRLNVLNLLSEFEIDEFDYALCFDLLEHLNENNVVFALKQIIQIAPRVIMSMACYGSAPMHLTVKTPGWWLDKVLEVCPLMNWSVLRVFERYTYCPVILMYGEKNG